MLHHCSWAMLGILLNLYLGCTCMFSGGRLEKLLALKPIQCVICDLSQIKALYGPEGLQRLSTTQNR